jgi:hypothetical protein
VPPQYAVPPQQHYAAAPQHGYAIGPQCRFCGCVPAVETTFRGHQGMLVLMRFLSMEGPFCRDCGLATFRHMTSRTLVQGWWGYASFVITPIVVLINLARHGKVASLPAPRPMPGGQSRRPMDPGSALLARPMTIIGLAIPFLLFLVLVLVILASRS